MNTDKEYYLAKFIAHVQADGCFSKERDYFRYFNKDLTLIKDFSDCVKNAFGITCKEPHTGKTCYQIGFRNKQLAEKLKNINFNSANWRIPQFVKKGTKNIKSAYLQAFFDDESCVTFRKRKEGYDRSIRLQSINQNGIKSLKKLLKSIKINSKLYGPIRQKYFEIKMMKKEELCKFYKKVGYINKSKQEKLEKALKTYASKWAGGDLNS